MSNAEKKLQKNQGPTATAPLASPIKGTADKLRKVHEQRKQFITPETAEFDFASTTECELKIISVLHNINSNPTLMTKLGMQRHKLQ